MTQLGRRAWQARSMAAALLIPPLLAVVSLARLAPSLSRQGAPTDPAIDPELAWWVDRLMGKLPPPWRRTCLRRAAVLFYLLRRAGRPVALQIGVARAEGSLAAHAWLELDGQPYLEPDVHQPAGYRLIASFPENLAGAAHDA